MCPRHREPQQGYGVPKTIPGPIKQFTLHQFPQLAVPLERVQDNFRRYGLLDVRFLKGWFRDTLPTAPIERLAILRLDGDLL